MRMSRLMGLVASTGMTPDSVTVTGGATQYWASASETSDKWHNINDGIPYDNEQSYAGRNSNKVYHNAALAFKTGSFTGKGKHISVEFSIQAYTPNLSDATFNYACQLSKHNWSTAAEWMAGSKTYYSTSLTFLPSDPNAVARATGTISKNTSRQTVTVSFDAEILPDTEYVVYLIETSGTAGKVLTIDRTADYPMTITVTE